MYENLPAVFEYARIIKGSSERVKLTYEEYLKYKYEYENIVASMNQQQHQYSKSPQGTFVVLKNIEVVTHT